MTIDVDRIDRSDPGVGDPPEEFQSAAIEELNGARGLARSHANHPLRLFLFNYVTYKVSPPATFLENVVFVSVYPFF